MKRFLGTLLLCWFLVTAGANAAELEASIKIDRMQSGTSPLPILVLVKINSVAVENGLSITVGSGWVVDSGVSVSVANLPNGVTAWPGMGNSTAVLGQMIAFPSDDLTTGTEYGFYITSGIGSNPSKRNSTWVVATNMYSLNINVPTVDSDQITVTGKVVPKATDFQIGLAVSPEGILKQNQQMDYEITYGSLLPNFTKPMVITAGWSRGTIEGSPIATVDGLEYAISSAGTAYGGVIPVVDLNNRTITWTISSFPANLGDQKIDFSLKTNGNYTGSSKVSYSVSADLTGANVITVGDQKTVQYQYEASVTPTPMPTSVPPTSVPTAGSTSGNGTAATTTPVPTAKPAVKIAVEKIEIVALTASAIQIQVDTNGQPEAVSVKFGNSIGNLNQTLTSINALKTELLKLNKLLPGRDYYFIVEVKDGDQAVRSDMFTFRTPEIDTTAKAKTDSIMITSQDVVIADAAQEKTDGANIVIPIGQVYSVKINLDKPEEIKSAKLIIRNRQVLGITSVAGAEPNSVENNLIAIGANGGFSGQLISPATPGFYELYLTIEDIYGGINEQKIGNLKVATPLRILDSKGEPIEGARVLFSKYDQDMAVYQLLPSLFKGLVNPSFTEANGSLIIPLPKGSYRVRVTANGYHEKNVDFILGMGGLENPPEIKMDKTPFSLIGLTYDYSQIVKDVFKFNQIFYNDLSQSRRVFRLMGTIEIGLTAVIILIFFGRLYKQEFWLMLPWTVSRMIRKSGHKNNFRGKIIDKHKGKPIVGAIVYLNNQKVKTNIFGEFELELPKEKKSEIKVMALGYFAGTVEYLAEGLAMDDLVIRLDKIENGNGIVGLWNKELGELIGGSAVVVIFLWQILFVLKLGVIYMWPFILMSIMDLILWWFIVVKVEKNYVD